MIPVYRLAVVLILLLLGGCAPTYGPTSAKDRIGLFQGGNRDVIELLAIYPDGTFLQTIKIKRTGETVNAKGTWHYDPATKYTEFKGMLSVFNYAGRLKSNYKTPPDKDQNGLIMAASKRDGVVYYRWDSQTSLERIGDVLVVTDRADTVSGSRIETE